MSRVITMWSCPVMASVYVRTTQGRAWPCRRTALGRGAASSVGGGDTFLWREWLPVVLASQGASPRWPSVGDASEGVSAGRACASELPAWAAWHGVSVRETLRSLPGDSTLGSVSARCLGK